MTKELLTLDAPALPETQSSSSDREGDIASLSFIFFTFLKVGSTAFGGFMALITVVESIIVERRKLLTHEDMLDGISLASVLPGPVAANVVAYVGYRLRGGLGAFAAAFGVLLPSFVLVLAFTIAFLQFGDIPEVGKALAGFIPAVAAIILHASWRMGRKAVKGWIEAVLAVAAAAALLFVSNFYPALGFYTTLGIVASAGAIGWLCFRPKQLVESGELSDLEDGVASSSKFNLAVTVVVLTALFLCFLFPPAFLGEDSLARLFTTFAGMSLMLFGGGYVFIPLIQNVVVDGLGWVNPEQFTTAIAIGQITPGPILISAAFIGYAVKGGVMGVLGSAIATLGIFLPPAIVMVTCSHWLERIKRSDAIQAALRGIRPAVVGMIFTAAVTVWLSSEQTWHWATAAIFIASAAALLSKRVGVVVLIPMAGLLGLLLY